MVVRVRSPVSHVAGTMGMLDPSKVRILPIDGATIVTDLPPCRRVRSFDLVPPARVFVGEEDNLEVIQPQGSAEIIGVVHGVVGGDQEVELVIVVGSGYDHTKL
jgi:hypothetical protein